MKNWLSYVEEKSFVAKKLSQAEVNQLTEDYNEKKIPKGWFLHGNSSGKSLKSKEYVIQSQRYSFQIAFGFAGKRGSLWFISPNNKSNVLDFSNEKTSDMNGVVDDAIKAYWDGSFPFFDDMLHGLDFEKDEKKIEKKIEKYVRSEFTPNDIVNSAQAFDNIPLVEWLYDEYGFDFVITPDGAVAIPNGSYNAIKVDDDVFTKMV